MATGRCPACDKTVLSLAVSQHSAPALGPMLRVALTLLEVLPPLVTLEVLVALAPLVMCGPLVPLHQQR